MKRQRRTRLLSWILALCMVLSMLPVSVLAEYTPPEGTTQDGPYPIEGTSLQYTLYGQLIPGGGLIYEMVIDKDEDSSAGDSYDIPSYDDSAPPWGKAQESLQKVYISSDVTGIGDSVFVNMSSLTEVEFEDLSRITSIGENAFAGDSRAEFVDESTGKTNVLDLSHVTTLGAHAFENCSQLTGVTLNGDVNNGVIPERAFSGTRLTEINVPEGIKTIETGAFAGITSATAINLPDSLVTIGDQAFACSRDGTAPNIPTLTIPQNVESIGARAFYGYKNTTTVIVETEKLDNQSDVGDAAFGNDETSAYYGDQTLSDGTVLHNVGTIFKLPASVAKAEVFVTGENCFTGPISPLALIDHRPAMCGAAGWNVYQYTDPISQDNKTLRETLTALQPNYIKHEVQLASCTTPTYDLATCDNWFVYNKETGEWVQTTHTHNLDMKSTDEGYEAPKGHMYEATAISEPGHVTDSGGATVTFTCQNPLHDPDRDSSGGNPVEMEVEIVVSATVRNGETEMTLEEVSLPNLTNGTLEWEDSKTKLTYQGDDVIQYFPVTFTPSSIAYNYLTNGGIPGTIATASEAGGVQLTVGVRVVRQELDFSKIAFSGANVPVDIGAQPSRVTVQNAPTEAGIPTIQYWQGGDDENKTDNPPDRNSEWIGWVSATYIYDAAIYYVDEKTAFENGTDEAPYYMDVNENGANSTVTITHRYQVVPKRWNNITANPIDPTYSGQSMKGVHLAGITKDTVIEWSYTGPNGIRKSGNDTMEDDSANIDVVDVMDAGVYTVNITLKNEEYETETHTLPEITVTVHKRPLPVPTVNEDLQYTGQQQTGVADPAEDALYTISGNKGTDAKDYTATATLKPEHTANYC